MPTRPTAVVVGYNRFGGVVRIADLLQRRGYAHVAIVLNAPEQMPELAGISGISAVKVRDSLSTPDLLSTVRAIPGFQANSPFLCLTDKPMFAYLDAFEELQREGGCHGRVPIHGIRCARMKPRAREQWDAAGIKGPRWRVVSGDPEREYFWSQRSQLREDSGSRYIVKPLDGAGSENVVSVSGWGRARQSASAIRANTEALDGSVVRIGDTEFFPNADLLIEEEMDGPEYTIDGFVQDGSVHGIVQHKETRRRHPFFGDGLIVSPPDPAGEVGETWPGYEACRHGGVGESQFMEVVTAGLRAIQLDNWAFHAEMIVVDQIPRFVELNPRPAGGCSGKPRDSDWGWIRSRRASIST